MTRGSGRDDRSGEAFASRWSRRKRGGMSKAAAADAPRTPAAETLPAGTLPAGTLPAGTLPAEPRSDAEILRELGLPDPDALKPGDDITGFMARAVPAHLRNRVLRRLWTSNPVLANLDGLVDYGEDFTDAALVPKVLETAYRVGRGWAEDAAREEPGPGSTKAAAESEAAGSDGPIARNALAQRAPEDAAHRAGEMPAEPGESVAQPAEPVSPGTRPRRTARKMRFRFAED